MLLNTNSTVLNISAAAFVKPTFPEHALPEIADPVDRDLLRRVKTFLSTSHRQSLRALDVQARSGVVVLRGKVQTFYEKQLSAQLARRVAGVVRLIDHIVVNRPNAEGLSNEILSRESQQTVVTVRLQSDGLTQARNENRIQAGHNV